MTHNRITVHRVCPPNNGHNYAINLPTWVTIEHAVTNVNLTFCSFFVFFFSMSKFYIFFLFLLSFQHAHRTSSQTLILIKSMEREREAKKKIEPCTSSNIYVRFVLFSTTFFSLLYRFYWVNILKIFGIFHCLLIFIHVNSFNKFVSHASNASTTTAAKVAPQA